VADATSGPARPGPPDPLGPLSRLARGKTARWLYLLDRVLQLLTGGRAHLRAYLLTAQPIAVGAYKALRPTVGALVRTVGPGDPLLAQFPRPARVLQQRFDSGSVCRALLINDRLAGFAWLSRGVHEEDEVRCRYELPPDGAWDFDIYIDPSFRNGRAMARLWQAVDQHLASSGVTWSFSRISLFNLTSVQSHERLGAAHVGTALFLRLGPLQLGLFTDPWRVHIGLSERQRPSIVLRAPSPAALVLGADSHALAVTRALADADVPVYTMRKHPPLPGAYSNRPRRSFAVPIAEFERFDDGMVDQLIKVRHELREHPQVALIAINDRQVATIGRNLPKLVPHFRIAWADGAEHILRLQRKSELEAHCATQGLRYPRSVVFGAADDAELAAGFLFPMIVKPVRPLSSFKTLIARDAAELRTALEQQSHDLPILGQEYIEGGDSALYFGALMLDRGRVLHGMVGRKIASHPPARGQTTIAETVEQSEVLALTERFFEGLGLSGPVSLELKRDPQGQFWVIEPTVGRTDFWAELCIGAGFNQPLMQMQIACGLPVVQPGPTVPCVWYDTERDPLGWLQLAWRARSLKPRAGRQVFQYWAKRDPLPFLRAVGRRVRVWVNGV